MWMNRCVLHVSFSAYFERSEGWLERSKLGMKTSEILLLWWHSCWRAIESKGRCPLYIHHHFQKVLCKKMTLEVPKFGGELAEVRKLANKYTESHPVRIQAQSNFHGQDAYQGCVTLCVWSACNLRGSLRGKACQKLVGGAILIVCHEAGCWIPSSLGSVGQHLPYAAYHKGPNGATSLNWLPTFPALCSNLNPQWILWLEASST